MDIKDWLDQRKLSPEDAAEIFGKSAGTIRNWRSSGVPQNLTAWVEIRAQEYDLEVKGCKPNILSLEIDEDTFRKWSAAAAIEGMFVLDWLKWVADGATPRDRILYQTEPMAELSRLNEATDDESEDEDDDEPEKKN